MSEFLLIQGNTGEAWAAQATTDNPAKILLRMIACLRDLDRIGAHLPAVYLETAVHHLRNQFELDEDSSGTD